MFFLNITQAREQQRQNLLNAERFLIISEQTKDVIFEWEMQSDILHYSPVYEKVYGAAPPLMSAQELLAGDLALQRIAGHMRALFRSEDILVRMGGNEFAVFLIGFGGRERLQDRLEQFFLIYAATLRMRIKFTRFLSVSVSRFIRMTA